jgi:uracil-DNA glycosylase
MQSAINSEASEVASTRLVYAISLLQQEALKIKPPFGTDRLPARGGLPGPAFFPEGLGLSESSLHRDILPTVMAIGHNFGCAEYRTEIDAAGREDDKATWRNLDSLLVRAGSRPEFCYRTNWFVGLLPGKVNKGKFLRSPDQSYEAACNRLLIGQIKFLQPKVILLLGPEVAGRVYQIIPALSPWRGASRFIGIDRSSIGHSPRKVHIPAANVTANIAALLHPSYGAANQGRRMKNMLKPISESDIISTALQA